MKQLIILVSVAALLVGCTRSSRNVQLTVVNESAATLTTIVAAGSGFSSIIGSLAPGAKRQVLLKSDMGGFNLEFDANGKHFSKASPKDPWNGMKEVIMTVTTHYTINYECVTTF